MKIRTLIAAVVLSGLGLSTAHATPTDNTGALQAGPLKVKAVITGNTGSSSVTFTQANGTDLSCGSSTVFSVSRSHASHDLIYRTALAGFLSGRAVGFLTNENISGTCWLKGISLSN
jgi:hypothetical protein